eukprot:755889-Hanusia_phi.AAC.8
MIRTVVRTLPDVTGVPSPVIVALALERSLYEVCGSHPVLAGQEVRSRHSKVINDASSMARAPLGTESIVRTQAAVVTNVSFIARACAVDADPVVGAGGWTELNITRSSLPHQVAGTVSIPTSAVPRAVDTVDVSGAGGDQGTILSIKPCVAKADP